MLFMLVAALPLAGAALAPAVPGVGAWQAARSLAYLRSSTITSQAPKQASGAAAEAEGTRDGEGAYDPSTWAPPSGEVGAPSNCSLLLTLAQTTVAPPNPKPAPTPILYKPVANTNSRSHTNATPNPNPYQLLDDYWKNQQAMSTATSANEQAYRPHPLDPQGAPSWATFSDTDFDHLDEGGREPWWKQVSSENYTEDNRPFRRTVFMHDDWVRHRSSERFLRNMRTLPSSGINQALSKELTFVTLIALSIVGLNALGSGYQDFSGVMHEGPLHFAPLVLPALP